MTRPSLLLLDGVDEFDLDTAKRRVAHARAFVELSTPDGPTNRSQRWRSRGVFRQPNWRQMGFSVNGDGHRSISMTVSDDHESIQLIEAWNVINPDSISDDGTRETIAALAAWHRALRLPTCRAHSRATDLHAKLQALTARVAALHLASGPDAALPGTLKIIPPGPGTPGRIRDLDGRTVVDRVTETMLLASLPTCLVFSFNKESYQKDLKPTQLRLAPPEAEIHVTLDNPDAVQALRLISALPAGARAARRRKVAA